MCFLEPTSLSTENEAQLARTEKGLRQRLIDSFVRNNQLKYAEISEAIESGEVELAHRLAHTLKSNAGQLGYAGLQKTAEEIENHLSDRENRVTPTQLASLESGLKLVLNELSPLVSVTAPAALSTILETELTWTLFRKLEPLLETGDSECHTFIDDLRRIPGSESLIRQIEDFEFDFAVEELSALMDMYDRRN